MAISNLSTSEMIGLSAAWLDAARHRKTLQSSPRVSPFVADLTRAHEGLMALGESTSTTPAALSELQATEATVDAQHDRKARGTSMLLAALRELADTDEERQGLTAAIDLLFPQGLGFLNTSYAAEAGNVEATERRFREAAAVQSLLKKTRLPWGDTALDEVQAWFAAGHELGKLEAQRLTQQAAPVSRPGGGAGSKARGRWLSVVSALLASIDLDDEPSAEVKAHVLAPLAEAEARADARSSRRKAGKTEPSPTEPAAGGTTP